MIRHTRGHNVSGLLSLRRPNEPVDYHEYRLMNARAWTKGGFLRAESKLSRIFGFGAIEIEASKRLQAFIDSDACDDLRYFSWLSQVGMRRVLEDGNGWFTWIPFGAGLVDPSVPIQIKPYIIYSIYVTDDPAENGDQYITFCMPERIYYYGKNGEYADMEYWTIDRENIFVHRRTGRKKDDWVTTLYYRHGMGYLPIRRSPGIRTSGQVPFDTNTGRALFGQKYNEIETGYRKDKRDKIIKTDFPPVVNYNESYFSGFIPNADEALCQFSDAQAAYIQAAHPIRVEEFTSCPEKGCVDGKKLLDNGDWGNCPTCKGGVIVPNPLGYYTARRIPSNLDSKDIVTDPVRIIPGDPSGVKSLYDIANQTLKKAEEDIWLKDMDKVMSAEQVDAGNSGEKSLIKKIGDAMFELANGHLADAEMYIHGSDSIQIPVLYTPLDYDIRTEAEVLDELNKQSDSSVPTLIKISTQKSYAMLVDNGRQSLSREIDVMAMWDKFYAKDDQLSEAVTLGQVDPVYAQKHYVVDSIVLAMNNIYGYEWKSWPDARIMEEMDKIFSEMSIQRKVEPGLQF